MGNSNQQQGGGGDRPRQQEQQQPGSNQRVKPRDDEGMAEGNLDAGNIASPDAGDERSRYEAEAAAALNGSLPLNGGRRSGPVQGVVRDPAQLSHLA